MRSTFSKVSIGTRGILLTGAILVLAGCAGGYSTELTDPIGDGMLIIGSSIVEQATGLQDTYTTGQEISIMADQEIEGELVRKAVVIWADDEGYFCVENLPQGKYTLKGVRITGNRGGEWTIWNELRMPNERWMYSGASYRYSFTGEYFHFSPRLNVFNFQHSVFSLQGGTVRYYPRAKMENEKFHNANRYTRDYVEKYFIEKYPDSGWTPILQTLMPVGEEDR